MAGGANMKEFSGPFSSYMESFLNLRRSLGFIYERVEYCLYDFDQYLLKNFPNVKVVSRKIVTDYLKTTCHLSSTTRSDRVSDLRQFLKFLFQFNTDTYIPEKSLVPPRKVKLKPHIYTEGQLLRLMEAARGLPPAGSLRPHTYVTIIGLLWVSGLRIGEVVRLNTEDVDLEQGLLHIRQTKFFKSRIVPISISTTDALSYYIKKRDFFCNNLKSINPFFVNQRLVRCNKHTIQSTFRELATKINLKTPQGTFPRLHDFRHSFATRWIDDLYKSGKDPNAYLPILATYLGHANIANTQVYLHMSMGLLHNAGERLRKYIKNNSRGLR